MKRILANLKDYQHERLKKEAYEQNISMSEVMRKAIDAYFRRTKKEGETMRLIMVDLELLKNIVDKLTEHGELKMSEEVEKVLKEAEQDQISGVKL